MVKNLSLQWSTWPSRVSMAWMVFFLPLCHSKWFWSGCWVRKQLLPRYLIWSTRGLKFVKDPPNFYWGSHSHHGGISFGTFLLANHGRSTVLVFGQREGARIYWWFLRAEVTVSFREGQVNKVHWFQQSWYTPWPLLYLPWWKRPVPGVSNDAPAKCFGCRLSTLLWWNQDSF